MRTEKCDGKYVYQQKELGLMTNRYTPTSSVTLIMNYFNTVIRLDFIHLR